MEILNIKVDKELKEKLDRLVQGKAYKTKSEAVRSMLEEHLEEHPELFAADKLTGILKETDNMSDRQFERLAAEIFRGPGTAAELVAEGRERHL